MQRSRPILALLVVATLTTLATPTGATHIDGDIQWACGFGGSGRSGHPDQCGIDPIGGDGVQSVANPSWGKNWLGNDERIIGVVVNGDARAIPVKMMDRHEILNDIIGGERVSVTYCPLCGSGLTFLSTVEIDGEQHVVDFAPSGFLYQHDLVMWDPQTGTLWNQITGQPIARLDANDRIQDDHPEAQLTILPTAITTWPVWVKEHPKAVMLQAPKGFSYGTAYPGYSDSCRFGISSHEDCDIDGLHPKTEVIGIERPTGPIAFAVRGVGSVGGIAYDNDTQTVVHAGVGRVTKAWEADNHTFTKIGHQWSDETGATWDLTAGTRDDGSATLEPIEFVTLYWFAWRDHHPGTLLWGPSGTEETPETDPDPNAEVGGIPGPSMAIMLAVLGLMFAILRRRP